MIHICLGKYNFSTRAERDRSLYVACHYQSENVLWSMECDRADRCISTSHLISCHPFMSARCVRGSREKSDDRQTSPHLTALVPNRTQLRPSCKGSTDSPLTDESLLAIVTTR